MRASDVLDSSEPQDESFRGITTEVRGGTHRSQVRARQSKREIANLTFPFALQTALGSQDDGVDHGADSKLPSHDEDPRHRLPLSNSLVSVVRDRLLIVYQKDASPHRCPVQDCWIITGPKADILNAYDVHGLRLAEQRGDDITLEVFVGKESEH